MWWITCTDGDSRYEKKGPDSLLVLQTRDRSITESALWFILILRTRAPW